MRKLSGKRIAATVAILCVLITGSAIAGGKVVHFQVGSSPVTEVKSYQKVKQLKKKTGIPAKTVEQFQNDFTFQGANVRNTEGMDEENNVVESYKDIAIDYGKGTKTVSLYLSNDDQGTEEMEKDREEIYKGISLASVTDHYKFVPEGYQMTEEEKEMVKRGELYISEGSEKMMETDYYSICWEENGVKYLLSSMEDVSEKVLLEMAKELIDNGK